ncbi:MAG: TetR/AcrR family transcriptional regulator [Candidatus Aminicenantes bacterium]|nr:TetR/AcrR family transcriptional regulator [Candidatus Aminicenantes bacterium]
MNEDAKSAKFQQLVTTATELFLRHGIRRVSIEEICHTAKVSKMTFYKYFKNKVDLAKYAITQMVSEAIDKYRKLLDQDIPYLEKVKQMVNMKMEQTDGFSRDSLGEFIQSTEPEIAELLHRVRQESFQLILRDFIEAQKKGDIRQDVKPEFILYFFNHIVEMISDEELAKLYDSPQALIMELTNFFFYGILPREQSNEK